MKLGKCKRLRNTIIFIHKYHTWYYFNSSRGNSTVFTVSHLFLSPQTPSRLESPPTDTIGFGKVRWLPFLGILASGRHFSLPLTVHILHQRVGGSPFPRSFKRYAFSSPSTDFILFYFLLSFSSSSTQILISTPRRKGQTMKICWNHARFQPKLVFLPMYLA